jgi:hypothetical protein
LFTSLVEYFSRVQGALAVGKHLNDSPPGRGQAVTVVVQRFHPPSYLFVVRVVFCHGFSSGQANYTCYYIRLIQFEHINPLFVPPLPFPSLF